MLMVNRKSMVGVHVELLPKENTKYGTFTCVISTEPALEAYKELPRLSCTMPSSKHNLTFSAGLYLLLKFLLFP